MVVSRSIVADGPSIAAVLRGEAKEGNGDLENDGLRL